jgi:hypothetical protein
MIVYCTQDLIFATKIRSTADAIGIVSRPARNEEMLAARLACLDDGKGNEPVTGVLVDLEMGEAGLDLVRQARYHACAPTVVAFGSHVAVDLLAAAESAGAHQVMARSRFSAILPAMLETLARRGNGPVPQR